MFSHLWFNLSLVGAMVAVLTMCGSGPGPSVYSGSPVYTPRYPQSVSYDGVGIPDSRPRMSSRELLRQVNLKRDYIPYGRHARKYRRHMDPRFITIHSTQNYSASANAWQHSKALKNGKLRARKRRGGNRTGYLVWHYTIDESRAVQHLPDNEQGEHADFDGPGNNFSLGLEMCENRGNSRSATVDRTAKLAAYLMKRHGIPIGNVVPHYHWPRAGVSKPNKNCPHFLLDNGRPGRKWRGFQDKVLGYYKMITRDAGVSSGYAGQGVYGSPYGRQDSVYPGRVYGNRVRRY